MYVANWYKLLNAEIPLRINYLRKITNGRRPLYASLIIRARPNFAMLQRFYMAMSHNLSDGTCDSPSCNALWSSYQHRPCRFRFFFFFFLFLRTPAVFQRYIRARVNRDTWASESRCSVHVSTRTLLYDIGYLIWDYLKYDSINFLLSFLFSLSLSLSLSFSFFLSRTHTQATLAGSLSSRSGAASMLAEIHASRQTCRWMASGK